MNELATAADFNTVANDSGLWCDQSAKVPVFVSQPMQFVTRVARLIVMQEGQKIDERRAWSNIEITLLNGRCKIEFIDREIQLAAHQRYVIAADQPHQVHALTDVRAVISFDAEASDATSLTG